MKYVVIPSIILILINLVYSIKIKTKIQVIPWSSDLNLLTVLYKSIFKLTLEIWLRKDDKWRIVKLI